MLLYTGRNNLLHLSFLTVILWPLQVDRIRDLRVIVRRDRVAHHSVELAELSAGIHITDPESVAELIFLLRIADRHTGVIVFIQIRLKIDHDFP